MNKREKQYHREMDSYEQSMFDCINRNLKRMDLQLMHKYKKVRSSIKKSRIMEILEKKHCIDNFIFNFEHKNIDVRLFHMLFGIDYRYINNSKLYRDLYNILVNARQQYKEDKVK